MAKQSGLPKEKFLEFYRQLMTVRRFEEKVDEFFRQGKVVGAVHTSVWGRPWKRMTWSSLPIGGMGIV
jgi:TPP-dependent pyruvate/acetoin dehydrogenase alpha subunit